MIGAGAAPRQTLTFNLIVAEYIVLDRNRKA